MSNLQSLIAQKEALDAEIKQAQDQSRAEAISKVRALMTENGVTLADIGGKTRSAGPVKVLSTTAKYRDPATGESWVGRGKRPAWLSSALAAGKTLEQFAAH